jgi:hypothetical protein
MNKYLMLTAAAVLATTASASAGSCFSFTMATFDGGAYCDGGRISTGVDGGALSGAVRAWVHTNNNCNSGTSQGQGLLAKIAGLGKSSVMSDTYFAKNYGIYSEQLSFALPKTIKNGQLWTLWVGMNGTTSFEVNTGVLLNVGKCQNGPKSHGTKSTVDVVKEIIAAHRNAKALSE